MNLRRFFGGAGDEQDAGSPPPLIRTETAPDGAITLHASSLDVRVLDGAVRLSPQAVGELVRAAAPVADKLPQDDARALLRGGR